MSRITKSSISAFKFDGHEIVIELEKLTIVIIEFAFK